MSFLLDYGATIYPTADFEFDPNFMIEAAKRKHVKKIFPLTEKLIFH